MLKRYLKDQKLHLWLDNQMIVDKIWAKIDAKYDYLTTQLTKMQEPESNGNNLWAKNNEILKYKESVISVVAQEVLRLWVEGSDLDGFAIADQRQLGVGVTDADGVATISGLPRADAVVKVSHLMFASPTPPSLTLPASGVVSQRVVMLEPGFVDVTVARADGAAAAITDAMASPAPHVELPDWDESQVTDPDEEIVVSHNWDELRRMMWDYVGIVRTNKRL